LLGDGEYVLQMGGIVPVLQSRRTDKIIPRWGIPRRTSSNNGSHFINMANKLIGEYFSIDLKSHCAIPASSGAVERENGTLKNKLTKCCADTSLAWTKVRPVVLLQMRARIRPKHGLRPYEVLFGGPPKTGVGPVKRPLPNID